MRWVYFCWTFRRLLIPFQFGPFNLIVVASWFILSTIIISILFNLFILQVGGLFTPSCNRLVQLKHHPFDIFQIFNLIICDEQNNNEVKWNKYCFTSTELILLFYLLLVSSSSSFPSSSPSSLKTWSSNFRGISTFAESPDFLLSWKSYLSCYSVY